MEEEPVDEAAKALAEQKANAQKEKEAGNAAYKARQFEEAIQHYDLAIKLDDSDISFLTNRQGLPPLQRNEHSLDTKHTLTSLLVCMPAALSLVQKAFYSRSQTVKRTLC